MARYGSLVVEFILGILILMLLSRFLLSGLRSRQQTLIEYSITRLTDWLVQPFMWMPRLRGYELATLLAAWAVCFLLDMISLSLRGIDLFQQPQIALPLVVARSVLYLLMRLVQLYIFIIFAGLICSWLRVQDLSIRLTVMALFERYMRPFRRLIPLVAHIDLSPVVALLCAQLALLAINDSFNSVSTLFF